MLTSACERGLDLGQSRHFIFLTGKPYACFTDLGLLDDAALLGLEGSRTVISTSTAWNNVKFS